MAWRDQAWYDTDGLFSAGKFRFRCQMLYKYKMRTAHRYLTVLRSTLKNLLIHVLISRVLIAMHFPSAIIPLAISLSALATAAPGKEWAVEERAVCNADNVLRALRAPTNSATASQFCYSLILQGVPTTTLVKPAGVTPPPV